MSIYIFLYKKVFFLRVFTILHFPIFPINFDPWGPWASRNPRKWPGKSAVLAGRETGRMAPSYDSFSIFCGGKSGNTKNRLVFIPRPHIKVSYNFDQGLAVLYRLIQVYNACYRFA